MDQMTSWGQLKKYVLVKINPERGQDRGGDRSCKANDLIGSKVWTLCDNT